MTAPDRSAVLVVDDDAAIHMILEKVVERAGGEAFMASDGKAALALLDERAYAAAVLDKNLPDVGGIELLKIIKQKQPRTEVLMVTGYAGLESAVQALRLGAFDYLEKPFDIDVLTDRVRHAIARRKQLTADVAQSLEAPLQRLVNELEVVIELTTKTFLQLRSANVPAEVRSLLTTIEQAVGSVGDAADGAKQILHSLARTP